MSEEIDTTWDVNDKIMKQLNELTDPVEIEKRERRKAEKKRVTTLKSRLGL